MFNQHSWTGALSQNRYWSRIKVVRKKNDLNPLPPFFFKKAHLKKNNKTHQKKTLCFSFEKSTKMYKIK